MIQIDMKMPKCCTECALYSEEWAECQHTSKVKITLEEKDGRPDDCPLKELQESEPKQGEMTIEEAKDRLLNTAWLGTNEDRDKTEEAVRVLIDAVEPKQGDWISVEDRLPEENQSVLVWCPQYKNIYCAYLEAEQWWIFGTFSQIVPSEIIAWMPIPPYKGDKENK